MRGALLTLSIVGFAVGCSCQDTGITGVPDARDDARPDPVEDTEPACWDRDDDGYLDEACGGDDCDDSRSDVYPGASEVCLDGVDQDCDGLVDGPMLMREPLQVSDSPDEHLILQATSPIWVGSAYMIEWGQPPSEEDPTIYYMGYISPDADEVLSVSEIDHRYGSYAWTGSNFGTSWEDAFDIYVKVVDERGDEVSVPTRIAYEGLLADSQLIWTGSHFSIIIARESSGPEHHYSIVHTRVNTAGEILVEPFNLNLDWGLRVVMGGIARIPAWTGASMGVAWTGARERDSAEDASVYFMNVQDTSTAIGEYVRVSDSTTVSGAPSIVWAESQFGVAWYDPDEEVPGSDSSPVMFTRLDIDGNPLMDPAHVPAVSGLPVLRWTGSRFGLLYSIHSEDAIDAIGFKIGDVDGSFHESHAEIPLSLSHLPWTPMMTWSGSEFGVIWIDEADGYELFFGRIGFCE
jgi:hypothetical protein